MLVPLALLPTLRTDARGRHDPLPRQPHQAGARGPRPRRAADAASALCAGPLAGAAGGPRGAIGRRARQAPLPALRGRADDPLAPAHERLLARGGDRRALAEVAVARVAAH